MTELLWPLDLKAVVPSVLVGAAGASLLLLVWRPAPRLAPRLRPYNSANRVRLGRPADIDSDPSGVTLSGGAFAALFGPILSAAAIGVSRLVDRESDDELLRRLRQANQYQDIPRDERLFRYRKQRLLIMVVSAGVGVLPALMLSSAALVPIMLVVGAVFGLSLPRAQLDSAIKKRKDQMTIDLYTVNQHLAMLLMTGRGVDEALQRLTHRGRGPIIAELSEAIVWRRAGMPLTEALDALSQRTAEPHAARTYQTLAKAAAGGGVADALLHLSDDVRNTRRDALQRLAVRRRATMILPIVFLLVPPLLILVGAPLPAELFGQLP